jgi:hypothetical protein
MVSNRSYIMLGIPVAVGLLFAHYLPKSNSKTEETYSPAFNRNFLSHL